MNRRDASDTFMRRWLSLGFNFVEDAVYVGVSLLLALASPVRC
jgi:hypothetical protein